MRRLIYTLIVLLALLHQDVWWWDRIDPLLFGFIPIGLTYHACVSVAAAVLWGIREGVDRDRRDAMMETGTVHLIAISGLHVGILAGFLFALLRMGLVPRTAALVKPASATGERTPCSRAASSPGR